ncbi:28S ribosomal protein S18c, mitochondrial [Scaptodrosophila lebanonensis]|uniref:28S ribosomal protein S18c, mitochondrial n=1 Tax=Drosophila lebanonensis TaxID=7225 RepID=A0A6J2T3V9_DROLE|nr:28S ribosomal protein S18c, mitochondrial [Scaptodrosophila lebanonensis]
MLKLTKSLGQSFTITNLAGLRALNRSYAATNVKEGAQLNPDEPIDMPNPFEKDPEQCILCKHDITPYYKNVKLLSQFQSPYTGRIYGRHITGLCKQKQEDVEQAIKRAQRCLLMPGYHKDLEFLHDPKLFDPERPSRPHKY